MKGKAYRETIKAGKTIMQRTYAAPSVEAKKQKRKCRENPTSEAVKKTNLRNAIRKLTAILNNNFGVGDYHMVLTYAGEEPTQEEAKRNLQNFLRRIKYYCKRRGEAFKWVGVTEYKNHRIHHHIVCTGLDPKVLTTKWKYGFIEFTAMEASGNYPVLAEYLIKETDKTFREDDSVNKKRYTMSGTIVIPEVRREEVSVRQLFAEPKAYAGYYIDQDTVTRYTHAILGIECTELIQVSLEETPRIKKWYKGNKIKYEREYKITEYEEQLRIEGTYDS